MTTDQIDFQIAYKFNIVFCVTQFKDITETKRRSWGFLNFHGKKMWKSRYLKSGCYRILNYIYVFYWKRAFFNGFFVPDMVSTKLFLAYEMRFSGAESSIPR